MDDYPNIPALTKEKQEQDRILSEQKLNANEGLIAGFIAFCAKKGVDLKQSDFQYSPNLGITANLPNILTRLNSELTIDKEGLFLQKDIHKSFKPWPDMGVFWGEQYRILVHPYFRRGHNIINNFPSSLVQKLLSISDDKIEMSLALDVNRVRIDEETSIHLECDYWFGPKFSGEIEKQRTGPTRHGLPSGIPKTSLSWLFDNNYALMAQWSDKSDAKSFQAKAFKDETIFMIKDELMVYPTYYVHAEYDLDLRQFRHFDGAMHFYTEEEYFAARDLEFKQRNKVETQFKAGSKKLFKLNGIVSIEKWVELMGEFMSGNPLIHEYFTGKYSPQIEEQLENVRQKALEREGL